MSNGLSQCPAHNKDYSDGLVCSQLQLHKHNLTFSVEWYYSIQFYICTIEYLPKDTKYISSKGIALNINNEDKDANEISEQGGCDINCILIYQKSKWKSLKSMTQ